MSEAMSRYSLSLTSDIGRIEEVRGFIKEAFANLEVPAGLLYHLQLAIVEAVTNVMEHAYGGLAGKPIDLVLSREGEVFEVLLTDEGVGFDFEGHPDPDLAQHMAERKVGGLGVYLMRNLMDEVSLCRDGGVNTLRMRKSLVAAEA